MKLYLYLVTSNEFNNICRCNAASPAANFVKFPILSSPKGLHSLEVLLIPMPAWTSTHLLSVLDSPSLKFPIKGISLSVVGAWLLSLSIIAQGSPTLQPVSVPVCFLSIPSWPHSACLVATGSPLFQAALASGPPLWNVPHTEQLPVQAIPEVHNPLGPLPPACPRKYISQPFPQFERF